jgi:hypothetical protein
MRDLANKKAYEKEYYAQHSEPKKARSRAYYLRNKTEITEKQKAYRKQYYEAHKEQRGLRWKEWAEANPEKRRSAARKRNLASYGLDLEKYQALLDSQKGVCAVCFSAPERRLLQVDHDHETGEVRGLLCRNCNLLLGHAKDSIPTLESALAYLRKQLGQKLP